MLSSGCHGRIEKWPNEEAGHGVYQMQRIFGAGKHLRLLHSVLSMEMHQLRDRFVP